MRPTNRAAILSCLTSLVLTSTAFGHVHLPSIFGSHMVLQQQQANRVWGWADAGDQITVSMAGQSKSTTADDNGRWQVTLDPLSAGGPHRMVVKGHNELVFDNVMVGEVWICSGQSNMAWPVQAANDSDLETLTADFPNIRLISVPQVGTDEPQDDFKGQWQVCTPQTAAQFSAVGYFFGRQLHQTLNVPIGLIDNAWGGSAAEAWVNRDTLEADEFLKPLMDHWKEVEQQFKSGAAEKEYAEQLAKWEENADAARKAGEPAPPRPCKNNSMTGNQRPANIYNGVLRPTIGYGIRGVIWYQGESNAGRAYQYRHLFPLMIESWRKEWGQGDFPFYWVQLADFRSEKLEPADSDWAELREAQTMAMSKLPNTGEAVILNLGEASDIHPKNKQDVAKRLAALGTRPRIRFRPTCVSQPALRIDGKAGRTDRAELRPCRRRPRYVRRERSDRVHHGRRRSSVPLGNGTDSGQRARSIADQSLERSSQQSGCRPLRLGRQPGVQRSKRGRFATDTIPDRRLAGNHRRPGLAIRSGQVSWTDPILFDRILPGFPPGSPRGLSQRTKLAAD